MVGKILHTGKNLSKARHWKTRLVCYKYIWGEWGSHAPGTVCNISPHLSLETVFLHNLTKYEIKGT